MIAWFHTCHYIVPRNPANQRQTNQDKGKSPLNMVQGIPSGIEDEMVVPMQVVTWAQAKEILELQNKRARVGTC